MPRFPSVLPFERTGDESWVLNLRVPHDARIEYLIEVERGGHIFTTLDPANPHSASNPFGTNSVFVGPQWRRVDWTRRQAERGRLREIRVASRHLGSRRHHVIYTPPQLQATDPAPLLVVHDGSDYINHAGLLRCVDALSSQRLIEPIRIVGLNPGARHDHYIGSEAHAAHIVDEVLPHVRRRVPHDGRTAVMGASLGAVASWHAAWTYPDVFEGALLQSGTFAFDVHPELSTGMQRSISRFVSAAVLDSRVAGMRIMQTCGQYESLIDWNRQVAEAMSAETPHHRYVETWSGHDWGAWSGTLAEGLRHLFGRSVATSRRG